MLDKYEAAWAAGLFDGEGSIGLYKSNGKFKRLSCHIAQTDRQVLDRFCAVVGVGKVYGPYKQNGKNNKPYYGWYLTKGFEDAQHVVTVLWNWLSPVKRNQCKIALESAIQYYNRIKLKPGPKSGTGNTLSGKTWKIINGKRVWSENSSI